MEAAGTRATAGAMARRRSARPPRPPAGRWSRGAGSCRSTPASPGSTPARARCPARGGRGSASCAAGAGATARRPGPSRRPPRCRRGGPFGGPGRRARPGRSRGRPAP